jgi:ABC-type sugar transport system ATPase subunit
MTLADRIVVLRSGRIEQVGAPLDLYNRPANLFVAGFIGSPRMNLLPATVLTAEGADLLLRIGTVELVVPQAAAALAAGAAVTVGIRPEHIAVAPERDALDVTVDLVEHLGGETFVYAAATDLPQITLRCDGQTPLSRGDATSVRFSPEHLHLFDATGAAIARP